MRYALTALRTPWPALSMTFLGKPVNKSTIVFDSRTQYDNLLKWVDRRLLLLGLDSGQTLSLPKRFKELAVDDR